MRDELPVPQEDKTAIPEDSERGACGAEVLPDLREEQEQDPGEEEEGSAGDREASGELGGTAGCLREQLVRYGGYERDSFSKLQREMKGKDERRGKGIRVQNLQQHIPALYIRDTHKAKHISDYVSKKLPSIKRLDWQKQLSPCCSQFNLDSAFPRNDLQLSLQTSRTARNVSEAIKSTYFHSKNNSEYCIANKSPRVNQGARN